MSQIQEVTVIFPDHVYDEIQLLQKELSYRDSKMWSISDTISLLLEFCLEEEGLIHTQNYLFLVGYMYERESFSKDFTSSVFKSMHSTDYDR